MRSVLRSLVMGGARTVPPQLRSALARAPGVRRLYAGIVAPDRTTISRVVAGPLRGTLIEYDPAAENRYWGGRFERGTQRLMTELPLDGAIAWDVGAHVGFFSLLLAKRCERVLAVEPAPGHATRLRANVELNRAPVEVIEAAVGREPGTAHLVLADDGFSNRVVDGDGGVAVPQTTLDRLAEEHGFPAFIKIDVEGAELDVLLGGANVLSRRPRLLIEAHSPALAEEIEHLLTAHGYSIEPQAVAPGEFARFLAS
jgi:FkbM family methyltransferase